MKKTDNGTVIQAYKEAFNLIKSNGRTPNRKTVDRYNGLKDRKQVKLTHRQWLKRTNGGHENGQTKI